MNKKKPRAVDLKIPMLPEMELTATQTAEAVARFAGLDTDQTEEVKLALIEACINAFEHSKSKDGRININFEIGEEQLTIHISDRGQGFDLKQVQDQLQQRHGRGEHRGWGLKIMKELMDEVKIDSNEQGTTITMVKRR
jgi:serine/threonine-protein kinase RsbW